MVIEELKGVGDKTKELLNKINIYTLEDLVHHYPYRYDLIKESEVLTKDNLILQAEVLTEPTIIRFKQKDKMTFVGRTKFGDYLITIFNRGYLKNNIKLNNKIIIFGKVENDKFSAYNIRFGLIPRKPVLEPVYFKTNKLTNSIINKLVNEAIPHTKITSYLPEEYQLLDKKIAINQIHNPNVDTIELAISTLKKEEAFVFMTKINYIKTIRKKETKEPKQEVDLKEILAQIPFELTNDQLKVVNEIYEDTKSTYRMNRLIQGDVASGKTIVAFIAMMLNAKLNYQSALMAPTDVLARQHYHNFQKVFNEEVVLLTGKMKKKEKEEVLLKIKSNEAKIIIGTHALLTESVIYHNLGLVITDEQHRFGVNQRTNLKNKGNTPDVLYLSATPIPRTYALTLYGDMDISLIKEMPKGRKEIKTYIKNSDDIKDVLSLMLDKLKNKEQVYVVAPMIEEDEDLENVLELKQKMEKAFGKYFSVGLMHGKMKQADKEKIMEDFKANKIQILVSTTVIEVGVDVSNANIMVIFNSERFGLSTLHQLRGRVGRGFQEGICILMTDSHPERLNILEQTNDGFIIAEEDFKQRGSGDLFGYRQSGDMQFKLLNLKEDYPLLKQMDEVASNYLKNYPNSDIIRNIIDQLSKYF